MTSEELEEMTIQFLKEHDPNYYHKKRTTYSYLSKRQVQIRKSKEIPISNLSNKQKQTCPKLGDSIDWNV